MSRRLFPGTTPLVVRNDAWGLGNGLAFTILELVIVMAIISMVLLAAIPTITSSLMVEQRLREVKRNLQLQAKTARQLAITSGTDHEITLLAHSFSIGQHRSEDEDASNDSERTAAQPTDQLAADQEILLFNPQDKEWKRVEKYQWRFSASGLTEPLEVRIREKDSWIQLRFNPLTASVDDESFFFP